MTPDEWFCLRTLIQICRIACVTGIVALITFVNVLPNFQIIISSLF